MVLELGGIEIEELLLEVLRDLILPDEPLIGVELFELVLVHRWCLIPIRCWNFWENSALTSFLEQRGATLIISRAPKKNAFLVDLGDIFV